MNIKLIPLVAAAALLGTVAQAATPTKAAPKTAADGKAIYTANCAGCHGPQAKGAVGPSLKDAASWKYDLFKRAVLTGVDNQGKALKPMMPHFGTTGFAGKKPTDAQLKALQAFIKTATK